jgi:hypothetical protein
MTPNINIELGTFLSAPQVELIHQVETDLLVRIPMNPNITIDVTLNFVLENA